MGGGSSPPAPPNPSATASAQTGMNIASAQASDIMNMVNQYTPYGNLNYNQTGTQTISLPQLDANGSPTGKMTDYQIPTFSATQSYSPVGQQLLNYQQAAQLNEGQGEVALSQQVANELQNPLQLPSVPTPGNVPTYQANYNTPTVAQAMALPGAPTAFTTPNAPGVVAGANVPGVTNAPGSPTFNANAPTADFSSQAIQDQMYKEYSPRIQQQQAIAQQTNAAQLAAQGLTQGSAAYNNAINLQNQAFNDQWNQMYLTGQTQAANQAQQQYSDQYQNWAAQNALAQQTYANQFQNAQFGAQQGQQQFANTTANIQSQIAQQQQQYANILNAQQQTFGQQQNTYEDLLKNAQQGTVEQQQTYQQQYQNLLNQQTQGQSNYQNAMASAQMQQQQLQQYYQNQMQNTMQQYNFPLQVLSTVMSGAQPGQPSFGQTPTTNIAPANYEGDVQNAYADQMSAYNAQMQQSNAMMGGIFSMMGGLLPMLSDERAKEGLDGGEPEKVGELDNELPIYLYRYKGDNQPQIGVIAQDVEKRNPRAVRTIGGFKYVNYDQAVT